MAEDRGLNLVVKMQKGRFTASVVDGTVKTSGADHGLPHGVIAEGSISYKELLSPMQCMAAWYCRLVLLFRRHALSNRRLSDHAP